MERRIRRAMQADAPAIAELHVRAWRWAYRGLMPDSLLASLSREQRCAMWSKTLSSEDGDTRVWLCEEHNRLVGFVSCGKAREPASAATGEIYAIYQEEDVGGTGVGGMLFSHARQDLYSCGYRSAVLWVLDSNVRARRFYERAGFREDGGKKTESRNGHILHELRYRGDLLVGPKS